MSGITAEILELGAATSSNLGIIIPALVAAMAYFQYELLDPEARPIDVPTDQLLDKYDFIVVGAGSAGAFLRFLCKNKLIVNAFRGCCGK